MSNQFLVKETMDAMRNLSATEIDELKGNNPTYAGVQLLGYYEKGDTPAPIEYYLSNTTDVDDGGSVIGVAGVKLVHDFKSKIDLSYFGTSYLNADNRIYIENLFFYINNIESDLINVSYFNNRPIKITGVTVFDSVKNIDFNNIIFDINSNVYFKTSGSLKNITFYSQGTNSKLIESENGHHITNIQVIYKGGTLLSNSFINPINIADNSKGTIVDNIVIKDYYNITGACSFMGIRVGSGCTDISVSNIKITNITQLGNGVIGDTFGAVRGIYWHNITQDVDGFLLCSGSIDFCYMEGFKNINSAGDEITEDCDGIHIYGYGTDLIPHGICNVVISNVNIKNTGKRNVKFQASGCRLISSRLTLDQGGENLFIFSRKTFIDSNEFYNNGGLFVNGGINNSIISNNYFEGNDLNECAFQMQSFVNNNVINTIIKRCKTHFRYLTSSEDYAKHEGFKNSIVSSSTFYLLSTIDLKIGSNSAEFNPIEYRDCTFVLNINENLSTKILASSRHIRSKFILESISVTNHIFNINFSNKYFFKDISLEIKPSVNVTNNRIFQALTYNIDLTVDGFEIIGNNKSFYVGYLNCGKVVFRNIDASSLGAPYLLYVNNNETSIVNNNINISLENINLNPTQLIRLGAVAGISVNIKNITQNNDKQLDTVVNSIQVITVVDSIIAERLYVGINNPNSVTNLKTSLDSGLYYKPDKTRYKITPDSSNIVNITTI